MTTFSHSALAKGSDLVTDFCCSPCLEHNIDHRAVYYCDNCLKCYCAKCVNLHDSLFGKHVTYGRRDTSKWPVSKEEEDFLQKCDLHEDKHLEMFCDDHSLLCCTKCVLLNHRLCPQVTLISESAKGPQLDLQQISRKIHTILETLKKLETHWNNNMQTLQASYDKQLHELRDTRQKINIILDNIEKNTMKELDDKLASLKAAVKTDSDNCNRLKQDLKRLYDVIHNIVDKDKAELRFIASMKCLEKVKQYETYLKLGNSVQIESSFNFQADSDFQQYLSKLSGLGRIVVCTQAVPLQGNPDQVFTVQEKSEYDVSIRSDSNKNVVIKAICVLSNGQILVADYNNKRVKLLNHQYQVMGQFDLSAYPTDMCQFTPNEVAVAVNEDKAHGVLFVLVNDGRLVKGTKFQFRHGCIGIAHYQKDLYITDGTALYKYSKKGALLNRLHEDASGSNTVYMCAVSPSGDKIFVTNYCHHKILTLASDGTCLHTFTDPDLQGPRGIHVTDLGQVLVCGYSSQTILQLDSEGKKKLATLATSRDGLKIPLTVCYNRSSGFIVVGQYKNLILVYKVK